MEKRTPHHPLLEVKAMVEAGRVKATLTSLAGAAASGLDFEAILKVVMGLTAADFYKSMTTHADHREWQDVYRPHTSVGRVYLKLMWVEDVLIVSFKEL